MIIATIWSLSIIMLILFSIAGIALFYRNGKFAKRAQTFSIIVIFAIVLSVIAYISMPSEFIFDRIIALVGGIAAIVALIIKGKMFFASKVILMVSMSINMVIALI
ncbi:MAG: hypothetical protein ACRC41_15335 [Sarcina sp.]